MNFDNEDFALLYFYASWCGPCRMLTPILKNMSDINIHFINFSEEKSLADKYQVIAIPTILFLKKGVVVHTMMGINKESVIRKKIESLI